MDKVVRFSPERSGLFTQTAANMGITPALVEKDFWVSWVLNRLYQHESWQGYCCSRAAPVYPKPIS